MFFVQNDGQMADDRTKESRGVGSTSAQVQNLFRRFRTMSIVVTVLIVCQAATSTPFLRIPESDRDILSRVAAEYRLSAEQRRLLFVIRLCEWGGPGRELGVLTPQAQRHGGDHERSMETQARWAAGTIRKRWTGDLESFARCWCPPSVDPVGHRNWVSNARWILEAH